MNGLKIQGSPIIGKSPSVVVKDNTPTVFKEKSPMKASPTVGPIGNKTPDLIPPPLKPPSQAYAY